MEPVPRKSSLPLPPIGIDRAQAAAYIGVEVELFDRLVAERRMPEPRTIHGRFMWDAEEVAGAFRRLPHRKSSAGSVETNSVAVAAQERSRDSQGGLLFTPETLAERWKCSARHIRNMIERGVLPAFKAGGKLLRIKAEVVEAFERQGGNLQSVPESYEPHETSPTASEPVTPKRPRAKPLLSRRELDDLLKRRR